MESSQIFGAAEECHSNDSGWTMYIGSSIDDDDGYTHEANPEDDSDDSMASDASSGPSFHRNNPWGNCEGGHGQQAAAQEEEFDGDDKYSSANKSKEKQIAEKKVQKEEVLFIDNNKGKAPTQRWQGENKSKSPAGKKKMDASFSAHKVVS